MGASASIPEVKSTPNLTMAAPPPSIPHSPDSELLTERQKRRRFEKAIMKRGFEGNVTINPDPREATRDAHQEFLNASHWGDKDSRMVFWAKGCTVVSRLDTTAGLGIVSQTSPDPDKWVWSAFRVMREVDTQTAEILAVAMALRIAKEECEKLAGVERPSKVVVYSSARDAILRIQGSDFVMLSGGVRMVKAGVRVVEAGLFGTHFMRKLGIEVELRWFPEGCGTEGALESNRAATEGAKHTPPLKGPDAFIKDVQEVYKRKRKARLRRKEAKRRKQSAGTGRCSPLQPA